MKTKIAAALSLVGVLGAGSAAALVNTQILDSGPTTSGASTAVLPPASSIELTVPTLPRPTETPTTASSTSDAPATSETTVAPSTSAAAEAVAPTTGYLTAFNVGDAGVVTVDVVNGQLVLVSAEPKEGWRVTKAEDDSNDDSDEHENEVEVEFTSSTLRVEFEAVFVDGAIVPKVSSESLAPPATAPATTVAAAPGSTTSPSTTHEGRERDDDHDDDRDDD